MYSNGETPYILVRVAVCPCLAPSMMLHCTAHSLQCNASCCASVTPPKLCVPPDLSKINAAHQAALKQQGGA